MTYTELTNLIKNFCDSTETTFVNTIADFIKKNDIVLIKGSRGMKMERFI